jgi:hypothetical protein
MATTEFDRLAPKAALVITCEVRDAVLGWVKQAGKRGLRSSEIELMHHVIDAER